MTAVEQEKGEREAARAMFRRLATGEELPRAELFAGCPLRVEWQQKVMARLKKIGVAEKVGEGKFTAWRLAHHDEAATHLQILSTDDEALAPVLAALGARAYIEVDGYGDEGSGDGGDGGGEAEEGSVERIGAPPAVANGATARGAEDDVRLDYALRLLAAMLENTIYIRDRVDDFESRLRSLEEAFK